MSRDNIIDVENTGQTEFIQNKNIKKSDKDNKKEDHISHEVVVQHLNIKDPIGNNIQHNINIKEPIRQEFVQRSIDSGIKKDLSTIDPPQTNINDPLPVGDLLYNSPFIKPVNIGIRAHSDTMLRDEDHAHPASAIDGISGTTSGAIVNISGQDVFVNSGSVTAVIGVLGEPLHVLVNNQSISGQVVDISGQIVQISGQSVTAAVVVNVSGQAVVISGQSVSISGQDINIISGQQVIDTNQLSDATAGPGVVLKTHQGSGNQVLPTVIMGIDPTTDAQTYRIIRVDNDGTLIVATQSGEFINISGTVFTSVSGDIVGISGQAVMISGQVVYIISGNVLKDTNQLSDAIAGPGVVLKSLQGSGNQILPVVLMGLDSTPDAQAYRVIQTDDDGSLHVVNTSGEFLLISGTVFTSISGDVVRISGQSVIAASGSVVSVSGNIVQVSGQDVFVNSGSVIAVINESGQTLSVNISGVTVALASGTTLSVNVSGNFVELQSGQAWVVANISGQSVFATFSGNVIVNVSGNVVNISGQDVILNSGSITAVINDSGQVLFVSLSGQFVSVSGSVVKISGETVSVSGQTVIISGQAVNVSGNIVQISGQDVFANSGSVTAVMNLSAQILAVSVSGNIVNTSGQVANISGQTIIISGQAVSSSGNIITTSVSGNIVQTSGQAPYIPTTKLIGPGTAGTNPLQPTLSSGGTVLSSGLVTGVIIKAVAANSSDIYVGTSGQRPYSGFGFLLSAGEIDAIRINTNLNLFYVTAVLSGDRVTFEGVI